MIDEPAVPIEQDSEQSEGDEMSVELAQLSQRSHEQAVEQHVKTHEELIENGWEPVEIIEEELVEPENHSQNSNQETPADLSEPINTDIKSPSIQQDSLEDQNLSRQIEPTDKISEDTDSVDHQAPQEQ